MILMMLNFMSKTPIKPSVHNQLRNMGTAANQTGFKSSKRQDQCECNKQEAQFDKQVKVIPHMINKSGGYFLPVYHNGIFLSRKVGIYLVAIGCFSFLQWISPWLNRAFR